MNIPCTARHCSDHTDAMIAGEIASDTERDMWSGDADVDKYWAKEV